MELKGLKPTAELSALIIDDNLLVQDHIKHSLAELDIYQVRSAENAYYGLKLCAEMQFDIVICAFNVKSDKDGFHILEEMKYKGYVSKQTILIFLSSDTNEALVNSVSELQPDDFWVKPINTALVVKRLESVIAVKRVLFNVFHSIDNGDYAKAIYYIERHLLNDKLKKYHPHLQRAKGDCLLKLREFEDAESYFRELLKDSKNSWVYLGFVHALLKQNKIEEIEQLLEQLQSRVETRFATYDLLAQFYVENQQFVEAYETIKKAAELAPRNIARNKKVWDLARLNHDQREQFKATVNMAKFAKNSIHDSPELLLNVIRSGIDLAQTTDSVESAALLDKVDTYIRSLEVDYDDINHFKEQLTVVKARVMTAREEKDKAQQLVEQQVSTRPNTSIEDNLDKVKVFHELGMREEAMGLLDAVKNQIANDSLAGAVTSQFVAQEAQEKAEIHFTPKQLNGMAVEFFKKKKMEPALHSLEQALKLSPKNVKIALSLLKVLVAIQRKDGLDESQVTLANNTINSIFVGALNDAQLLHFKEMVYELQPVIDSTNELLSEVV